MPELLNIVDNLAPMEEALNGPQDKFYAQKEFRLWLTSMPTSNYPQSILQSGVKITSQSPGGIKSNILQIYKNV